MKIKIIDVRKSIASHVVLYTIDGKKKDFILRITFDKFAQIRGESTSTVDILNNLAIYIKTRKEKKESYDLLIKDMEFHLTALIGQETEV